MRNRLQGIAFILFGFLLVYTMNVWNPWIPVIEGLFPPICNVTGLVFGLIGVMYACKTDN